MQGLGSLGSGLNQFGATLSRAMGGGTGGFNVSSLFGSLSNAGWNMGILSSSSQVLGAVMKGSWGLWDDGGYTGPGGKHDVAGLVHRGEVVWSQADVARWVAPAMLTRCGAGSKAMRMAVSSGPS